MNYYIKIFITEGSKYPVSLSCVHFPHLITVTYIHKSEKLLQRNIHKSEQLWQRMNELTYLIPCLLCLCYLQPITVTFIHKSGWLIQRDLARHFNSIAAQVAEDFIICC